jgi:antitoxin component YwqK of YwqJK toxin-antitoxin module/poly(3-hydroxybutyrate) depolymerase
LQLNNFVVQRIIKGTEVAMIRTKLSLPIVLLLGITIIVSLLNSHAYESSKGKCLKEYSEKSYNYLVYLPEEYNLKPLPALPLIIYLHGTSLRGENLDKLKEYGIFMLIEQENKEYPFIIISPQCPIDREWTTEDWFAPLLSEIEKKYRFDQNRIYLTGVSMGGEGTWYTATRHPERFAAIAPICGPTIQLNLPRKAYKIKHIPTWVFHGAKDNNVPLIESEIMVKSLKKYNGNVKLKIFPNIGHSTFTAEVYNLPFLYEWFFSHKKSNNYKNGQKIREGEFKDGKKHGKWTYWYENGAIEREEEFKDGRAHGKWKRWDENEIKIGEGEFREGSGKFVGWYGNGNKENEETFEDGKKHGKWRYWYENGNREREESYKNDRLNGKNMGWFKGGKKSFEIEFKDGKSHGTWKYWYENGVQSKEWDFVEGKHHGVHINWYPNGQKAVEGEYKDSKPHGKWTWWDEEGNITKRAELGDGKPVKNKSGFS